MNAKINPEAANLAHTEEEKIIRDLKGISQNYHEQQRRIHQLSCSLSQRAQCSTGFWWSCTWPRLGGAFETNERQAESRGGGLLSHRGRRLSQDRRLFLPQSRVAMIAKFARPSRSWDV